MGFALGTNERELKELENFGFQTKRLKQINAELDKYEEKVRWVPRQLDHFQQYLRYLRSLLSSIVHGRKNVGKTEVERAITRKCKELCEEALIYFPESYSLSEDYFKICKIISVSAASSAIGNLLKLHKNKEAAWKLAVAWYMKGLKNYQKTSDILLEALTLHSSSKWLLKCALQLELSHLSTAADNKKLKSYLQLTFKNTSDINFYYEILDLFKPHKSMVTLRESIQERIMQDYSDEPLMWHTLAQKMEYELDRQNCYCEGLKKLPKNRKYELVTLYIKDNVHQNKQIYDICEGDKVLNEAHESDEISLTKEDYCLWVRMNSDTPENAVNAASKGTDKHPKSVELWKSYLHYKMLADGTEDDFHKIFRSSTEALKEKALPLWEAILRYHLLTSSPTATINALYIEATREPKEISDVMKPQYLEWLSFTEGMDATVEAYKELATKEPYCKELHKVMAQLEMVQLSYDFERLEEVHRNACRQFKEDVDVWEDYIEFHKLVKKSSSKKMHQVYAEVLTGVSTELLRSHIREKYMLT